MSVFKSSDELYDTLRALFTRVGESNPEATASVSKTRLIMRMRTSSPVTETNFNGRHNPLQIIYGASALRPDIDLELPADLLHAILLSEVSLRKAYSSGKIKLRGPFWKAVALDGVFQAGQLIYPQVLREQNINGYRV